MWQGKVSGDTLFMETQSQRTATNRKKCSAHSVYATNQEDMYAGGQQVSQNTGKKIQIFNQFALWWSGGQLSMVIAYIIAAANTQQLLFRKITGPCRF